MTLIDAVVRYAAAGLFLNIALLAVPHWRRSLAVGLGAGLSISIVAILINSGPGDMPNAFLLFLKVLETPNGDLLWWLGLALFDDEFRPGPSHWLLAGVYCVVGFSVRLHGFGIAAPAPDVRAALTYVLSFAFMGHLIWRVVAGAQGDLLDRRRAARRVFIVGLAVVSLVIGLAEIFLDHAAQSFLRAALVLPIALGVNAWLTPFQWSRLAFPPAQKPAPARGPVLETTRDPIDARLRIVMEDEQAFLDHGLTIAALADRVGAPEHQLRAVINGRTGFRNFAAFVNHHRLEAAKAALRDPSQSATPILTIALNSGFASLATFNRVFKATTGMTPSAYRTSSAP